MSLTAGDTVFFLASLTIFYIEKIPEFRIIVNTQSDWDLADIGARIAALYYE